MTPPVAAAITVSWKWIAILIGLGALVLLEVGMFIATGGWNLWNLVKGEDGRPSTSKFQWLLWLAVVLFAYIVFYVIRARGGDFSALTDIPENVMLVLGTSTVTAALAKGIAVGKANRVAVATARRRVMDRAASGAGANPSIAVPTEPDRALVVAPAARPKGILVDDNNAPDLGKVQMVAFTFVAIGIFLATVIHQLAANPPVTAMPDIDTSLLVLMGISQGGYLAKKVAESTDRSDELTG